MRRVWALGVVAVLACAVGCGDSGGGKARGGGGTPGPTEDRRPDGGCTGSGCNPAPDGGTGWRPRS